MLQLEVHDHACQVVADDEDLVRALQGFLHGLQGKEGLFVHSGTDEEAWALLERAGPAAELREQQRLWVVGESAAFRGRSPRIDHDHAAEAVQQALEQARSRGRGLAIIVDASKAYLRTGRAKEWFEFEMWLGQRLALGVVLNCLYWQQDLDDPAHHELMMKAHVARLTSSA